MLPDTDAHMIEALRGGDERAFEQLVAQHQTAMVRVALMYVPTRVLAEEAVQETWIAVLKGLHRFEGRSSLKTWLFSILMNRAKTLAQREGRYIQIEWQSDDDEEPAVAPERFQSADSSYPDHWNGGSMPQRWDGIPEAIMLGRETRATIQQAIDSLPENQRIVITLRDVEMLSAEEVCNMLHISETNQRVLLHRARSKVRQALERYLYEQS